MSVGTNPRVLRAVTLFHLFDKHDFAGRRRPAAEASPQRHAGARRLQRLRQAAVYGKAQLRRGSIQQEDGTLGLQTNPTHREQQIERPLQLVLQGDRFERQPQQCADHGLDLIVGGQLVLHPLTLADVTNRGRHVNPPVGLDGTEADLRGELAAVRATPNSVGRWDIDRKLGAAANASRIPACGPRNRSGISSSTCLPSMARG